MLPPTFADLKRLSCLSDPAAVDKELWTERPAWAVMHVRPNLPGHGQLVWSDLLNAIGHHTSSTLRGRAGSHSEALAFAWLAAGHVTDIAVSGANNLEPVLLRKFCGTIGATGIRTWLVYDIETKDEPHDAELALAATPVALPEFLERHASAGTIPATPATDRSPNVPDVHSFAFVETANELLKSDDALLVTERFRNGRDETTRRLAQLDELNETSIGHELHQATVGVTDINELEAFLRGAEAGAFLKGIRQQVDASRWAQRGTVSELGQHLSTAEWNRIACLERPAGAAACVLPTLGTPSTRSQKSVPPRSRWTAARSTSEAPGMSSPTRHDRS
jgi:hypothetical protein